jgi:hypothetical protein
MVPTLSRSLLDADGYLGLDFLDGHRVTFDFENHLLQVSEPRARFIASTPGTVDRDEPPAAVPESVNRLWAAGTSLRFGCSFLATETVDHNARLAKRDTYVSSEATPDRFLANGMHLTAPP